MAPGRLAPQPLPPPSDGGPGGGGGAFWKTTAFSKTQKQESYRQDACPTYQTPLTMNLLGAPASRRRVGHRKPEHAGGTPALPGSVPRSVVQSAKRFSANAHPGAFNSNFEVGTVLDGGAGFQPAISGKPCWKESPAASWRQLTGKMPVPLPPPNAGLEVWVQWNRVVSGRLMSLSATPGLVCGPGAAAGGDAGA